MSGREPAPLGVLRGLLLAILLLGMAGALVELLLLEHHEDTRQLIPLGLLSVGLVVVGVRFLAPGPATMRLLQAVMAAFILAGFAGVWFHYQGNVEFEREMYPSMVGLELFREAMMGATPALAPGTMVQLGLVGLAYTLGHPLLSRPHEDEAPA